MSVNIQPYTSLKAPADVAELITLSSVSQLEALTLKEFVVLGEGTNVLFVDDYAGTVLVNQLKGVDIIETEHESHCTVTAQAGENWHEFVCAMSAQGRYGLENLALIPGTVGASPVQNIGAYGVEVAEVIESVTVFDLTDKTEKRFSGDACAFGYRDSVFKRADYRERYIITAVTFKLQKTFSPVVDYKELQARFAEQAVVTAADVLNAVIAIRQEKLPDYRKLPNAGSFFKNPIVSATQLSSLQNRYPDIPSFQLSDERVKIPAAWLIQTVGLKGLQFNGAGIYEKHALIVINPKHSAGKNIAALSQHVIDTVFEKFNISLVPEVRFIGEKP